MQIDINLFIIKDRVFHNFLYIHILIQIIPEVWIIIQENTRYLL
jgi:hypothetical protein